jgi:hypothetical protein
MKNFKTVFFGATLTRPLSFRPTWLTKYFRSVNENTSSILQWCLMALIIWSGDVLIGEAFEKLLLSSNFRFSNIYNGRGKSEIVILGNSRGHGFYQPEMQALTGMTTLNMSYNAMPVCISNAFLQDYLEVYPAPKKVLIEVSMVNKTEEDVITSFKVYSSQSERISSILRSRAPSVYRGTQISRLYNFNSEVFHRSLYYLNSSDENWVVDRKMTDKLVANASTLQPMTYSLTEDRLVDLSAIVNNCKDAGSTPVLIFAPMFPAYRQNIKNFKEYIEKIEAATGLPVKDYSNAFSSQEFFSDYLHLNKKGSIKFMHELERDGILQLPLNK